MAGKVRLTLFTRVVTTHVGGLTRAQAYYGGRNVRDRARRYAPKDTGELRDSIQATPATQIGMMNYRVTVFAGARHGRYQEYGTRGSRARPGRKMAFRPKGSGAMVFAQRTGPVPATRFMQRAIADSPFRGNFQSGAIDW